MVMHPAGCTSHSPARWACARTNSITASESCAGSVFGIATMAVKPPSSCGAASGLDGLGIFAAGLTQMHVEIDEARRNDALAGIEDVVAIE